MKFVRGAIPEDPQFEPIEEGWNAIREPDPVWMQVYAIPIFVVTGALLFGAIVLATPISWRAVMNWLLPAFLLMIPLHELIHALANPRFGMTPRTLVGVWPSRLLFYAHYEGELSRNRFLAILAAPLIVLTILPLLLCIVTQWNAPMLAAIALANGLGAAGDLLGFGLVLAQIPRRAMVRNKGWRSYWKYRS